MLACPGMAREQRTVRIGMPGCGNVGRGVLELIGGVEPAGAFVRRAIRAGKPVVTANKALIAAQGPELVAAAEATGVALAFEGAVAGGIPILRTLREALASDRVLSLVGIVNGTSNYVLSRMDEDGMELCAAVAEAQRLGYAEADPTLDIGGHDAAHKSGRASRRRARRTTDGQQRYTRHRPWGRRGIVAVRSSVRWR